MDILFYEAYLHPDNCTKVCSSNSLLCPSLLCPSSMTCCFLCQMANLIDTCGSRQQTLLWDLLGKEKQAPPPQHGQHGQHGQHAHSARHLLSLADGLAFDLDQLDYCKLTLPELLDYQVGNTYTYTFCTYYIYILRLVSHYQYPAVTMCCDYVCVDGCVFVSRATSAQEHIHEGLCKCDLPSEQGKAVVILCCNAGPVTLAD